MAKKTVYIEPRPNGQFAVMKANAKRASALCDTQAQAERNIDSPTGTDAVRRA